MMKPGRMLRQYYQALLLTAATVVLLTCTAFVSSSEATVKKSKLHNPEMVRNKEHVQEHLEELTGKDKQPADMTDEELEFHYFKLHDFDNNTKLDGLEILAAINHVMGHEKLDKTESANPKEAMEMRLIQHTEMIDQVLMEDDFNNDGYLTYLEFVLARRRGEAEEEEELKKTQKSTRP